ncbi:metallophosphoesterase [Chromobacterium sinusclupearum]|uniref:Metallophosphoesterase n=1 Tax=Chromobacterium sinusclupearum TaxID=2077146 RepID=A0A2K4MR25_9NEIS|nr:metallophosphoesterase [Chromobacterium sinusclupearum]POA99561.1 metallophosphoesterase [Chromobacterium sinusclupearum]
MDVFADWKSRIESDLAATEQNLQQKQQMLARLQQAHDQVWEVINSGSTSSAGIPWEFAHGLSILEGVLDGKPLPTTEAELPTRVMDDGTLLGCRKWELLDPLWGESLVAWFEHLANRAPWASQPAALTLPDQVSFNIAGDWGSGDYIAGKVAAAMAKQPADYTIHLGDVYYAGSSPDESRDFANWPAGGRGQFTLNSNHEMYSGAFGYFQELGLRFPLQQGTSYFSLCNANWLILGLDTAYWSDKYKLYMDGALGDAQAAWLKNMAAGWQGKILLLSHHQGYSIDGSATTPLYDEVTAALGRAPDYWYWGHLHNVICYQPRNGMLGRCVGHGAIPYGPASILDGKPQVAWAETRSADDSQYPQRVLNGFIRLELNGMALTETLYDENGQRRWPLP